MDAPDIGGAVRNTIRTRLPQRAEVSQWAHHVADLNTGQVLTTVLDQPPTLESRIERLSQLGSIFDSSIFGGPSYRLTARTPYQTSPEAWLVGYGIDYFSTLGV